VALSAGHVNVTENIENYTGIEAQYVANIARCWIRNVEYLTAVHGLTGSCLRGVDAILRFRDVYRLLYLLQMPHSEFDKTGFRCVDHRLTDQIKAISLCLKRVGT